MSQRKAALLFLAGFVGGCSTMSDQPAVRIYDAALTLAYTDVKSAMEEKRTPFVFASGAVADTCASYLALAGAKAIADTDNNQRIKAEYLHCDALALLGEAAAGWEMPSVTEALGRELLARLDLRSFPSSLFMKTTDTHFTLGHLHPDDVEAGAVTASYSSADWSFTIKVVAVADINHNRQPDWIVWVADEAVAGTYRGYSTLVVYDPAGAGFMQAVPYPVVPAPYPVVP